MNNLTEMLRLPLRGRVDVRDLRSQMILEASYLGIEPIEHEKVWIWNVENPIIYKPSPKSPLTMDCMDCMDCIWTIPR
jgi:hypothetical protein